MKLKLYPQSMDNTKQFISIIKKNCQEQKKVIFYQKDWHQTVYYFKRVSGCGGVP